MRTLRKKVRIFYSVAVCLFSPSFRLFLGAALRVAAGVQRAGRPSCLSESPLAPSGSSLAEREEKLQAAPRPVAHGDVSGVEVHGVAHDGQAQAGAAAVSCAALGDAVKPLEEPLEVFFRHAPARVVVAEVGITGGLAVAFQADPGAFAGIPDAVFHEIPEDGVEQ